MTDVIERDDLSAMGVDDLRSELARQIDMTAQQVARLALIWRELERRGEDLSALRSGIGSYLSAVASGRLLPEAVVRLAGNRIALRAVALLELEAQRALLDIGTVQVVRDGGAATVPVHRLTAGDISRAIDTVNGRVRPIAEQRTLTRRGQQRQRAEHRIVVMLTARQHEKLLAEARKTNRSASAVIMQALTNEDLI